MMKYIKKYSIKNYYIFIGINEKFVLAPAH